VFAKSLSEAPFGSTPDPRLGKPVKPGETPEPWVYIGKTKGMLGSKDVVIVTQDNLEIDIGRSTKAWMSQVMKKLDVNSLRPKGQMPVTSFNTPHDQRVADWLNHNTGNAKDRNAQAIALGRRG